VQDLHRLLDWGVVVEAVDLIEVDVVGVQPLQRRVDLLQDRLAGQPLTARPVVHPPADLGRQHDVLPAGELLDRPADQQL
jgi:hypothetical protein